MYSLWKLKHYFGHSRYETKIYKDARVRLKLSNDMDG